MRRVMHGVDHQQGTDLASEPPCQRDVVDGAERIRRGTQAITLVRGVILAAMSATSRRPDGSSRTSWMTTPCRQAAARVRDSLHDRAG